MSITSTIAKLFKPEEPTRPCVKCGAPTKNPEKCADCLEAERVAEMVALQQELNEQSHREMAVAFCGEEFEPPTNRRAKHRKDEGGTK